MINDYFARPAWSIRKAIASALRPARDLSGWLTKRQLEAAILIVNAIGAPSCALAAARDR